MNKNAKNFISDLITGGIAAGISKTLVAPIETIKLRLQTMNELVEQGIISSPYKGMGNCLIRIIKEEGIASLWKGNIVNMVFYFPTQSFNFAFKRYYSNIFKGVNTKHPLLLNIYCGSLAGLSSTLLLHPLDFIKVRFSNDVKNTLRNKPRKYKSTFDVVVQTRKESGIFGLYRGLGASCACMLVYRGLYLGLYDRLKNKTNSIVGKFLLGWGITAISGAAGYPFDTIRKRMIATSGIKGSYKTCYHCMKDVIAKEGFLSLYKGHTANLLRTIAGAGVLVIYDKLNELQKKKDKNKK